MKRMDRRKFMLVASVGSTGAFLVACGNDPDDVDLSPTMIPVEGAPPTLAPFATPGGGAAAEGEAAPADEGGDTAAGAGDAIMLEAQDPFAWSIYEFDVAPGQVIQVTNVGVLEHNFTVDELGIAEDLPNGEPVDITVPDDAPVGDQYEFYCSVPGHREGGMVGTLTIVEASAAAPAEEEEVPAAGAAEEGATGGGGPVTLEAQDPFNWSTNELEAAPGQVIQVTNTGVMEHDFVIDELEIAEILPSGEPVEVTLPDDLTPGDTYTYYCSIPGHRESGMEGTLTIIEAAAAAPAAGGDTEEEGTPAAAAEGSPAAVAGDAVLLVATDPFQWSTHALKAAPGQTIDLVNSGLLEHDFVVDELGLDVNMPIGGTVQTTIPEDATVGDEFEFYCSVPGHRESGMKGTLTIVEPSADTSPAAQAAGADATPAPEELPSVSDEALALMDDESVVTLEATDPYNWSWKQIEAAPGQVIRVLNRGVLEHDFVIDELDISQALPFGEPIDIQLPDSVAVGDTYTYYCSVPGHRERGMEGTLTIVEAGAMASPTAATPGATPVEEAGGASDAEGVDLTAVDIAFEPNEFTIPAGTDVVVTLTNDGVLEHDLRIDELGVASDLLANGESTTVTINGEPGTYEFYCGVPGHKEAGMVGTLTIE